LLAAGAFARLRLVFADICVDYFVSTSRFSKLPGVDTMPRSIALKICFALLLGLAVAMPAHNAAAQILGGQIAETKTYPATAKLIVDIPSGFSTNPADLAQPFLFDGTNLVEFNVTGFVTIRQTAPSAGFVDLLTGVNYNAPGGLSAIQQEIVGVNVTSITSPSATATSLNIGDNGDDGTDSTLAGFPRSFFSTGGAVENNPLGLTANGFLNLFMQVDVTDPPIAVPPALQLLGFASTYDIGALYNANDPLHLERVIDAYQPFNQPFTIPGGSPIVEMFMRTDNPFVIDMNTLLSRPLTPLRAAVFTFAELTIIPEPSSAVLAVMGVGGLFAARRRRKNRLA
jgi:MYXO-CTERM domain-containing protein